MATKTFTSPMGVIKVNGVTVGHMKSIRCTETLRRGKVTGIGELTPKEVPALEWDGKLSCESYQIKFESSGIPGGILRKVGSLDDFVNSIILQEDGITVVLFRKEKDSIDPITKIITPRLVEHATIQGCFADRETMDLSEGQISGKSQEFTYITPILFAL